MSYYYGDIPKLDPEQLRARMRREAAEQLAKQLDERHEQKVKQGFVKDSANDFDRFKETVKAAARARRQNNEFEYNLKYGTDRGKIYAASTIDTSNEANNNTKALLDIAESAATKLARNALDNYNKTMKNWCPTCKTFHNAGVSQ